MELIAARVPTAFVPPVLLLLGSMTVAALRVARRSWRPVAMSGEQHAARQQSSIPATTEPAVRTPWARARQLIPLGISVMKVDEPFARHFIGPGRSVATPRPM